MPVSISGPLYLVANVVEQRDKRRMAVHLVNYNSKNVAAVENIRVVCQLPRDAAAKSVKTYSPDDEAVQTLEMAASSSRVSFTVPAVKTYTVAVVSY